MKKSNIKLGGLFRVIFLTAMLCMIIPVIIISVISTQSFFKKLESEARSNLQQLSIEKMNEVSNIIENQISITKAVAESPYIAEDLENAANQQKVIKYLGQIGNNANGLYENFFITRYSTGFADCLGGATLHPVSGEPWYEECKKNGSFLGNNISPVTGRPVYVISYGVYRNGRFIGGLNNSIDLSKMTESITNSITDDVTKVLIVDTEGNVIASKNPDQILQVNFNNENDSTKQLMETVLTNESGIAEFNFDGVKNIGAYSKYGTMITLVYMPESEYKEIVSTVIRRIIISIILCIIIAVIVIFLIVFNIVSPIQIVSNSIKEIATGNADLTKRIDIKAKNEIKSLVDSFNLFSEKMQNIVTDLKSSQNELSKVGINLSDSTMDTESSITEILANIQSVNNRILNQSTIIENTSGSLSVITDKLNQLNTMIKNQHESVGIASNEVEEMLKNIDDVTKLVNSMKNDYQTLQSDVENGTLKQEEVTTLIRQISDESKMLQDANAVISGIAEQTNLLAMNAAIEAAHAGEAGKGFSVVADEIRKLSETSTQQSKQISEQLTGIEASIESVVTASSESQSSFSDISSMISKTNASVKDIYDAMEKQQMASKGINDSLKEMNASTKLVFDSSTEISSSSKNILDELNNLNEASVEMKQSITEMQIGAKKISETGETLSSITKMVDESISKSNSQINQFTV